MHKKEEKQPITWEVKDPKLPVVRSGHINRICYDVTDAAQH